MLTKIEKQLIAKGTWTQCTFCHRVMPKKAYAEEMMASRRVHGFSKKTRTVDHTGLCPSCKKIGPIDAHGT